MLVTRDEAWKKFNNRRPNDNEELSQEEMFIAGWEAYEEELREYETIYGED